MKGNSFISSRLDFKGKISVWATAISAFVMIVAVSIASGYRYELKNAVSAVCSDVVLTDTSAISITPTLLEIIKSTDGVVSADEVIIEPGIVRNNSVLEGVVFKGTESMEESLCARISSKLASRLSLHEGDYLNAYFIDKKVKLRKFKIVEVYPDIVELDKTLIVYCPISDLRRVKGWKENEAGAIEVRLSDKWRNREMMEFKAGELGFNTGLYARSGSRIYSNLFDWMQLIDMNVVAILLLMALVAAFNMVSGLLIMIMRSTPTIGMLKALGMDNRSIQKTFLSVASRSTIKGLAFGNIAGLLFCLIQASTHLLKLDPANYFVSFVPVKVNIPLIILTDIAAWAVIMLLLSLPARYISRIDPSQTIKGETTSSC